MSDKLRKIWNRGRDITILFAPRFIMQSYWRRKKIVVAIYQMGKVASSTIYQTLKSNPKLSVFQFHRVSGQNFFATRQMVSSYSNKLTPFQSHELIGWGAGRLLINPPIPVRIITIVREPIARNLSAYFQNLKMVAGENGELNNQSTEFLLEKFVTRYPQTIPLEWFDNEFLPSTGVDIYDYPFDREAGYSVIYTGSHNILVLRYDLDDKLKSKVLGRFLNIPPPEIRRMNEGGNKAYAQAYENLISVAKFPSSYLETMLSSKYVSHFYSEDEKREIFERWIES